MSKHTPGPWDTGPEHDWCVFATDGVEYPTICRVDVEEVSAAETEANARLISGAPGLLNTCKAVLHQLAHGPASEGDVSDITWCADELAKAIANAEGAKA